jgi:hypothetical protein
LRVKKPIHVGQLPPFFRRTTACGGAVAVSLSFPLVFPPRICCGRRFAGCW